MISQGMGKVTYTMYYSNHINSLTILKDVMEDDDDSSKNMKGSLINTLWQIRWYDVCQLFSKG